MAPQQLALAKQFFLKTTSSDINFESLLLSPINKHDVILHEDAFTLTRRQKMYPFASYAYSKKFFIHIPYIEKFKP
jgi:hypothetical protein